MATETLPVATGTVVVCGGGSCRKNPDHRKLCDALESAGAVVEKVGCIGVCSGPTVAVTIGKRLELIDKARGPAIREDLVTVTVGAGKPSRRLRKRMLGRSARNKATRKLAKRLERSRRG